MRKVAVITHSEPFLQKKGKDEYFMATAEIEYLESCEIVTIHLIECYGSYDKYQFVTFKPKDAAFCVGKFFSIFETFTWKILDFDEKYEESFINSCVSSFVC